MNKFRVTQMRKYLPSTTNLGVGASALGLAKRKRIIMCSWIRGAKLTLILKSLFVLELLFDEYFKTLNNFMSRITKRPCKGRIRTSGNILFLNNMT
jgi:hypothetical protein